MLRPLRDSVGGGAPVSPAAHNTVERGGGGGGGFIKCIWSVGGGSLGAHVSNLEQTIIIFVSLTAYFFTRIYWQYNYTESAKRSLRITF